MNRFLFIVIIFFVVLSIIGCSKSEAYGSEEAIDRGDVVYQNEVVNLERFEQFLLTYLTVKMILYELQAILTKETLYSKIYDDGKVIHYSNDNSNDEFAGKEKGKDTDVFKEVTENENPQGEIEYFISGCSKKAEHILISVKKNWYCK